MYRFHVFIYLYINVTRLITKSDLPSLKVFSEFVELRTALLEEIFETIALSFDYGIHGARRERSGVFLDGFRE